MAVTPISFGYPHVRPMGVHRTCGEPNEIIIKKNTRRGHIAALVRHQVALPPAASATAATLEDEEEDVQGFGADAQAAVAPGAATLVVDDTGFVAHGGVLPDDYAPEIAPPPVVTAPAVAEGGVWPTPPTRAQRAAMLNSNTQPQPVGVASAASAASADNADEDQEETVEGFGAEDVTEDE